MSPTTEDLRARIAAELEDLGNLPDLAPAAARAGARTLRRRRLAVGSTLGVVAVGGGALATQGGPDAGDGAGDVATSPSPSPSWDPTADGSVTTDEWHETVRRTLESLLPARYGTMSRAPEELRSLEEVRRELEGETAPTDNSHAQELRSLEELRRELEGETAPTDNSHAQKFTTSGGDPRLQVGVTVSGRDPGDETDWSCASQEQAREVLSCAEDQLDDGWFAVATTELAPATEDGGAPAHGTSLLLVNDGVFAELSISELGSDGLEPNQPANIEAQELVDLASTPEFLEMVRVGVEWKLDQPHNPDEITADTDPVWPTAGS